MTSRRQFCSQTLLAPVLGPALLIHPGSASAALPWLLSLLFGRTVQSAVIRTATTSTLRAVALNPVLQAAGLATAVGGTALLIKNFSPSAIWLPDSSSQELLINAKQTVVSGGFDSPAYIGYKVTDAATNKVDLLRLPNELHPPESGSKLAANYDFKEIVSNLRTLGAKYVQALATLDPEGHRPHPAFATAPPTKVVIASPKEVEALPRR